MLSKIRIEISKLLKCEKVLYYQLGYSSFANLDTSDKNLYNSETTYLQSEFMGFFIFFKLYQDNEIILSQCLEFVKVI